ncbi:GATA zinc finger domain-containing protein 8-like [Penaeus chinensis]|uniref:GATA zinc finger domain-containing protein 8-like n=1 Tax=Penaeus chinensis TaxID=139456 RepID=UPI001FB75D9C|nr:GATA zinc finger domain-containing protein 8-like [Penaeus chinensis]
MSSIILTVELIINIVVNSNNNNNNNNDNNNNNNNNNRNENMNMVMTENMNDNMAGRGIDVQNASELDRVSSTDVPRDAPPPQGTAKREGFFARPQDVNRKSISTLESQPMDISPSPPRRSSSKTSPSSRTPRHRCPCKKKKRKLDSLFKSLSKILR